MLSAMVFLPARLTTASQSRHERSVTPASAERRAPRCSVPGRGSSSSGASSGTGRPETLSETVRSLGARSLCVTRAICSTPSVRTGPPGCPRVGLRDTTDHRPVRLRRVRAIRRSRGYIAPRQGTASHRGGLMRTICTALVAAFALALVGAASATDDGVWLFPASHGADTTASWKAQEGEADVQGMANQAVLLEKRSFAANNSAAAHVMGVEGRPVQGLTMSFEYRVKDGVCNTTDPRWALFVQGRSGRPYEVNLGCKIAPTTAGAEGGWLRKTFSRPLISAELLRKGGTDASTGQVSGLALVFDRSLGHVYVDNLRVIAKGANNTWTYAGDNGGTTPPGGAPTFTDAQVALLAAPQSADEQLTQDELFASLSPEERALIDAEPAAG